MANETRPGFLDDGRPFYLVSEHDGRFNLIGPYMAVGGFESCEAAHSWLLQFFGQNARRSADIEREDALDRSRLNIEREEMLARLLEPKGKPN